jgi:hypothetical protein
MNIPRLAALALALGLATATLYAAPAASAHQGSHATHASHLGKTGHTKAGHHKHGKHHPARPSQHVLASGLLSPLRAAVAADGTAYVSENFAGTIDRIGRDGTKTTVYTDPDGYEVGGLSMSGRDVVFTVTQSVGEGENLDSWLKVLTPSGQVRVIADLHSYEVANNPDQGTTYGFRHIDPTCAAKWPTADNGPASYPGGVDSHPYATYSLGGGWTYVADAGGNDILLVSPRGHVRAVATLPAIPFTITADAATGMGLDPCFVGTTYWFEPVPTDVEVGGSGTVYVTSLPGGPEGPALGARGSVFAISTHGAFRLHPGSGHGGSWMQRPRQVVTGLLDPTGLAVTPDGTLYVAQMFADTISKVTLGRWGAHVSDAISTPTPGEVEWTPSGLYFTSNVLSGTPEDPHGNTTVPSGQLIRYGR